MLNTAMVHTASKALRLEAKKLDEVGEVPADACVSFHEYAHLKLSKALEGVKDAFVDESSTEKMAELAKSLITSVAASCANGDAEAKKEICKRAIRDAIGSPHRNRGGEILIGGRG